MATVKTTIAIIPVELESGAQGLMVEGMGRISIFEFATREEACKAIDCACAWAEEEMRLGGVVMAIKELGEDDDE